MFDERQFYDKQMMGEITDFEKLWEGLHRAGFFITIHLSGVDERDLSLRAFTERL